MVHVNCMQIVEYITEERRPIEVVQNILSTPEKTSSIKMVLTLTEMVA